MKKGELEAQRGGRAGGQRKKRNPIEDLKREVAIMRTLRHKNITALQEVVDDPSGNKVRLPVSVLEGHGASGQQDRLSVGLPMRDKGLLQESLPCRRVWMIPPARRCCFQSLCCRALWALWAAGSTQGQLFLL